MRPPPTPTRLALILGLTLVALPSISQHQHDTGANQPHGSRGMHHDFSDVERYSKMFDDPDRAAWQKPAELLAALGVEAGMTVADVGAGTGFFLSHLADAVRPDGHVLALDVEAKMVDFMRERITSEQLASVEARKIAPDDPGLEDGSVDRILIVNVWHHIDDRDRYAGVLRAALATGGSVAVVDYDAQSPHGPPKKHRLAPEVVKSELEAGGLSVEILEETLPYQYVVVGAP
ncbi:MAG: methyltransferase [Acidobacteriota bacterium]|nr:methyltransferase [Acidobacteriota bacterium]